MIVDTTAVLLSTLTMHCSAFLQSAACVIILASRCAFVTELAPAQYAIDASQCMLLPLSLHHLSWHLSSGAAWPPGTADGKPLAVPVPAERPEGISDLPADLPQPLLTKLELLTMQHHTRGKEVYLEWGSGASTLLIAPLATKVAFSVENQVWLRGCAWVRG